MGDGPAARVVHLLIERGLTVAVAESLTGGLLVSELIGTPGASAAVRGGVVAYDTELKHTLLGVDRAVLAEHGPVHAQVAAEMAQGVRTRLAVRGVPADIGVSTTGVAGPDRQGAAEVGTVFLGFAAGPRTEVARLQATGDRAAIRSAAVAEALVRLEAILHAIGLPEDRE